MNLLIVDDEVIAIQCIMNCIDWDTLPIEQVFTANSLKQAQDIFATKQIDIVVCDIEMPHGNGLELISWINTNYPLVVNIILSCHDDFHFAKQAVCLECMDYVLKPATTNSLMPILQKATAQAGAQAITARYQELGQQYQQYVQDLASDVPEPGDAVEQVHRYIIEHISEELTVSKLAGMVFLSPDYLSRSFKRRHGKSIIDFIVDYRMELAKQMLCDTGIPATDIAEKIGLGSNYSYFVKQFRNKYGLKPKDYREMSQKQELDTFSLVQCGQNFTA